ncbi:MAG: hypothetical protein GX221_06795 [Candidatus Riflebacteria bacterium]|nr:hypothetical protein [Candidatus Riflebacteria bacterium]
MRLTKRLMRLTAATLVVTVLFMTMLTAPAEAAGLFSRLKKTATEKKSPVKTALVGVAAVGGAILAAPLLSTALGFASGSVAGLAGGATTALAAAGTGLAGIGGAIWGGLSAAGGFVTGAIGALGGALGSMFAGIAGFIGSIISSPLLVPALLIAGAAVAGYYLYKKYKRQPQTITNSNNIPAKKADAIKQQPVTTVTAHKAEIPIAASQAQTQAQEETAMPVTQGNAPLPAVSGSDELTQAHAAYVKAYNDYMSKVTRIGGSENPDEEMRSNMLRDDTQQALNEYRKAYNKYVTLLRANKSK